MAMYGTGQPSDAAGQGTALPPMLSQRRIGGSMMPDSPDRESFSPTISPSPPVQDPRTMSHNPAPFTDNPRSIDLQRQRMSLATHQPLQSHSLPTRPLDGWADGYFGNAGATGTSHSNSNSNGDAESSAATGSLAPSAKRRRPEVGSALFPSPESAMPRSSSPYNKATSPKGNRRPLHSPRLSRSPPNPVRSPIGASMGSSSYRVGPSSAATTTALPSISHFVQSASSTSPLPIGSPGFGRIAIHEQLRLGAPHRRDAAEPHLPPSSLRRSSGSVGEESSIGGIGDTTVTGRDELSRSELDQLSILREENAYLRQRLHQLEFSVTQRHAEMDSWMGRMEKHIMRANERPL
ncbi:hypothetical protein GGI00_005038 [Coemansia sp. RSA 2681]|nr:hypothetical protein GGI00_005038 [Coemansia sp. RSA 2681]